MRNLAVLFIHFIATLARLLGPGGARSIVAESLLLKHQLLIVNRPEAKTDGKIRLQVGEIWIKKGTALQLATRADFDLMYRQRMEEEAEERARKRFKHFTEISGVPRR